MKLIIDIDNYQYEHFLRHYKDEPSPRLIDEIIANGIPLSEKLEKIKAEMNNEGWYNTYDKRQFAKIMNKHISELKGENK